MVQVRVTERFNNAIAVRFWGSSSVESAAACEIHSDSKFSQSY